MSPITKPYLRRLRNEIGLRALIADVLCMEHRHSGGRFRFLCPGCGNFDTSIHPRTNLGRCFGCKRNFNPIDLVMLVKHFDFLQAVAFLEPLLPEEPQAPDQTPS